MKHKAVVVFGLVIGLLSGVANAGIEEAEAMVAKMRRTCDATQFEQPADFAERGSMLVHRATRLKAPLSVKSMHLEECQATGAAAQLYYRIYVLHPARDTCNFTTKLGVVKGMAGSAFPSVDQTLESLKASGQLQGEALLRNTSMTTRDGRVIPVRETELTIANASGAKLHFRYFAYESGPDMVFALSSNIDGWMCSDPVTEEFVAQYPWP